MSSVTPPVLEVRDVVRSFDLGRRTVDVLRGVSLQVRTKEFVALRGASGSGKSTLLSLLGGLDRPTSGAILFEGRPLTGFSELELARYRNQAVGFIFQSYNLIPELDALENVCLPGRLARRSASAVEEEAKALLERVGLGHRLDHRPVEMSGGEQQRTAIARALINNPRILLADEPTGNLDSKNGAEIVELITEIRTDRELTLVLCTHDDSLANRAERSIELVDGSANIL